jgi:hypothetical protein
MATGEVEVLKVILAGGKGMQTDKQTPMMDL